MLAVYSAFLAVALLSPGSTEQSAAVRWVCERIWVLGLPQDFVTFTRMEVIANVAIVAPVSFIGSLVWRSQTWRDWTAYAFVGALLVELVQGLVLPHRQASFSDVVANATGACLGAATFLWVRLLRRRSRAARVRAAAMSN